ncbi:MAG: aminotransferase class V-fold PLP-dependent enzyme [Gemmatimonadota bacterium]
MNGEIYLDYAATSAVRPPEVIDAVGHYLREIGATPGRSGHARSIDAGRMALRCRQRLAELFGIEGDPGRIVFQLNATHALNVALLGLLAPGDRVIRTKLDHNAVRRPVAALARRGVEEAVLDLTPGGAPDLDQLETLLRSGVGAVRLLVLPHASNVTGTVLPVSAMAEMAHEWGSLVLLDAAQTVGHYPVDVRDLGVDLMAFTGHKGIPGPQGMGGLWVTEGLELAPLVAGGTGGDSGSAEMPSAYPDHLEAGTQNAPGIAGLAAATEWVLAQGAELRHGRESALKRRLVEGLASIPQVRIHSAVDEPAVGIVTLVHEGITPGELSSTLEREHGILGRAGLHCAPDIHAALGTLASGAFRLSIGWATTCEEIDRTIAAFRDVGTRRENR